MQQLRQALCASRAALGRPHLVGLKRDNVAHRAHTALPGWGWPVHDEAVVPKLLQAFADLAKQSVSLACRCQELLDLPFAENLSNNGTAGLSRSTASPRVVRPGV